MLNKNEILSLIKEIFTQYNNIIVSKIKAHSEIMSTASQNGHMSSTQASKLDSLATHTHTKSNITDFSHTHTISDLPTGTASTTLALGNHAHSGIYEPVISTKNTAFNVNFNTTTTNVKMNGTQSVGTLGTVARADHVHPSDTTRVATTTTINSKSLSSNITLTLDDVANGTTRSLANYSPSSHTHTTYVEKVTGMGLSSNDYTTSEKTKLSGLSNYTHPTTHPPSIIVQDSNNRFVTDSEKTTWNAKSNLTLGTSSTTAYRGDYGNTAYTHSQASHAPTAAQKNSDITKAEIEAKLTGNITSHIHHDNMVETKIYNSTLGLTEDKYQITSMVTGTTIMFPWVSGFTEIHLFFYASTNMELFFPDCEWQSVPNITNGKYYELIFTCIDSDNDVWLGKCISYRSPSLYNKFVFDYSSSYSTFNIVLQNNRGEDTTPWDGLTDWGDGTIDTKLTHTYSQTGIYTVKTKYLISTSTGSQDSDTVRKLIGCKALNEKMKNVSYLFSNCQGLTSLDMSSFDTSNFTNMKNMFYSCVFLTSLNLSNFNTSNVTNMSSMFSSCIRLTSLDASSLNTSNVTNMSEMFYNCSKLTSLDVSSFDTSKVTDMNYMFKYLSSISSINVSNFNTSNVTNMADMFGSCSSLISLDLSSFNTPKLTGMSYMFDSCSKLTSVNLSNFNTSNVMYMNGVFSYCSNLTSLNLSSFNTSNAIYMNNIFSSCSKLASLNISNFNLSKATSYSSMFSYCTALTRANIVLTNVSTSDITKLESASMPKV